MASSGTTSHKTRFTGAQLIVHLLERQGITTVAGIPGGTVLPLYDALSQSTQIRHVLARPEQRVCHPIQVMQHLVLTGKKEAHLPEERGIKG